MVHGQVNERRQAIVSIRVRGPDGTEFTIEVVVDTGFDGNMALSRAIIDASGLRRTDSLLVTLADGRDAWLDEYRGSIFWDGAWRTIPIQASDGVSLLGMAMLEGYVVCVTVAPGGPVEIE
jgi:clan AA aspartic protease